MEQQHETFPGRRGKYLLENSARPVAVGRASLIYRARAVEGGGEVCIKVYTDARARPGILEPDAETFQVGSTTDFGREFHAYGDLEHPNILPLIDYGRDSTPNRALFLVLPVTPSRTTTPVTKARSGLTTAQRVALWTAIITTIGTVTVALLNILTSLRSTPAAVQAGKPK